MCYILRYVCMEVCVYGVCMYGDVCMMVCGHECWYWTAQMLHSQLLAERHTHTHTLATVKLTQCPQLFMLASTV